MIVEFCPIVVPFDNRAATALLARRWLRETGFGHILQAFGDFFEA
jgi:hypothetical protein